MNCHLNDDNGPLLSASRFVQLRQLQSPGSCMYLDTNACIISSSIVLYLHKLTNSCRSRVAGSLSMFQNIDKNNLL